jgi:uncharacterized membrane protein
MKKYSDVEPITFSKDKKSKVQNRWKSKIVWASTFSLLLVILGNVGLYEVIGITEEKLRMVINDILSILVLLGVLNNPTDAEKF